MVLEVRVLGPVEVYDGERALDPGGPTAATLLGVLAANAPATVSSGRLVDAVWGEDPPASARKNLQAHLSKLRRAVAPGRRAGEPGPIVSSGDGYRLDVERAVTDLDRFRRAAERARSADAWRAALAEWRGEPLGGCADSGVVDAERTRLRELWFSAEEAWVEACIAEGRPGEAVGELERHLADAPLNERLWALLVEALGAAGRQSDALAAYQRARATLVESAGLEPGSRLRAAEQHVLTGEAPEPTVRGEDVARRTALPASRTPLVGRSHDVDAVCERLGRSRLVTVTGPGGCGKSTLALAAARRFADRSGSRTVFVDLVPATDEDGVARALAAALGIRYLTDPTDLDTVAAARLAQEPTLMVIDNCEHVIEAVAATVDSLLDLAEPLTVLATSRQPLEIGGEHLWPLQALPDDEAVALFRREAAAVAPFAEHELDGDAVAELCRVLDGLPLAIELAAARAGELSPGEMVALQAGRPAALRRRRQAGDRHDSLADTIRWSYDLLDEAEQACLRRWSIFRGSFDREQAAAVAADVTDPVEAPDLLSGLVARSLVVAQPGDGTSTYHLLDTIRAFARAEADHHGELADAAARHRDWYRAWAHRVPPGSTCLRLSGARTLERHHADLLAALETSHARGDTEALAELAVLGSGLLFCPGGHSDPEPWIARALEHRERVPERVVADLLGLGSLTAMMLSMISLSRDRIAAGAELALQHRSGAGPLLFAVGLCDPFDGAGISGHIERVIDDPRGLQDEIRSATVGLRPFRTYVNRGTDAALAEAEAVWEGRAWSDDRTMATWSVHAALLHAAGEHDRLAQRIADTEVLPPDAGPRSPFLPIFAALALAGTGDHDAALTELRRSRNHHWVHLPGVENDFLATVAAIATQRGETDQARAIFARPDLWPRHPSTAIVQFHHRKQLDLAPPPFLGSTDHATVSALLDDVLGR